MIDIPIEQRYRKENKMFHSGLYLGIASVAIAAGGAITSGVMADQAGRRQVGAARSAQRAYQRGLDRIGIFEEQLSPGQLLAQDMPYLTAAAQRSSQTLREEGEKYRPGAAELREKGIPLSSKAMDIVSSFQRGEIPQDVADQLLRQAAERGGASVNLATERLVGQRQGAASVPGTAQSDWLRNLGLTSLQMVQQSVPMLGQVSAIEQDWARIARAYTVGEFEGPAQYALGAGQLQQEQMALQLGALTGQYNAMQNVGAAQYAQGMGQAQSVLSGSMATSQALAGAGMGIGTYQQAQALRGMQQVPGTTMTADQTAQLGGYRNIDQARQVASRYNPPVSSGGMMLTDFGYRQPRGGASVSNLRSPY